MIRSSKSLLYGFISLIPYDVRSTKDGSTYLDSAGLPQPGRAGRAGYLRSLSAPPLPVARHETGPSVGTSVALRITRSTKP